MKARTASDLRQHLQDPGFTPSARDLSGLIALLTDDAVSKGAERSLARLGRAALEAVGRRLSDAEPGLRARLVRVLGRLTELPGDAGAVPLLLAALVDVDPKTRRNAAIALGRAHAPGVEKALLSAWENDPRTEMRRSIAASLGKVGGSGALGLLREATRADDSELARIAQRALMMVERTQSRPERGRIDPTRLPERPVDIVALSRRGLEDLLQGELSRIAAVTDAAVSGPGRVRARLVGPIASLFLARTMLGFHFPIGTEPIGDDGSAAAPIALVASSELARRVFSTWTLGPVRYRIAWASGGHQRAATWDAATAISRGAPDLVNDPTESVWEIEITRHERNIDVVARPRALVDPRFAWRLGDVPASSHPTIAAALARVAGPRAGDVVWDPFVGSGSELVERALIGPYRSLAGSDIDPRALAVARANLSAAGLAARLEEADALAVRPLGVTLIITNPPMGRRASREPALAAGLDRFVEHAASILSPRGRLVWIAPWPDRARAVGQRAGLALDWARVIDMGGFDAEMQRFIKS